MKTGNIRNNTSSSENTDSNPVVIEGNTTNNANNSNNNNINNKTSSEMDNININKEIEKKEVERKKEEEKERLRKKREKEAELKRNTKVLSIFKNSDNFKIKVTKVYSSVNLRLDAYTPDRHHWYTSYLGEYDENIDEKIETKDKMTIYRPKGIDVRIEVIRSVYSYTISIGDDFSENYSYRHHY